MVNDYTTVHVIVHAHKRLPVFKKPLQQFEPNERTQV